MENAIVEFFTDQVKGKIGTYVKEIGTYVKGGVGGRKDLCGGIRFSTFFYSGKATFIRPLKEKLGQEYA